MKFTIKRSAFIKPLQQVVGAVERKQALPILSHFLVHARGNTVSILATDLEIELFTEVSADVDNEGEITIPARKLVDICRALPEDAELTLDAHNEKVVLTSGKSRFTFMTLPVTDFPTLSEFTPDQQLTLPEASLHKVVNKSAFAMAQQDVRYYLNGLLFEVTGDYFRCVATDGHRLALSTAEISTGLQTECQSIMPRKGVVELMRLLENSQSPITLDLSSTHIRIHLPSSRFTSKLIDGKFPDYHRVLPDGNDKTMIADKRQLQQSLSRAAILSNEKYRGIGLLLSPDSLHIKTHNPDHEQAEDELAVQYQGDEIEVGFNVGYLIDILNVVEGDNIKIRLKDSGSSCLATETDSDDSKHVVMPMRL